MVVANEFKSYLASKYSDNVQRIYSRHTCKFLEFDSRYGSLSGQVLLSAINSHIRQTPLSLQEITAASLHAYYEWREGMRISPKHRPGDYVSTDKIELIIANYRKYLKTTRSLAKASEDDLCNTARHFLVFSFHNKQLNLASINESMILVFLNEDKGHLKPKSKQVLARRLSRFAKYLVDSGYNNAAIAASIKLCGPTYKITTVPKTLTQNQIFALENVCDTTTHPGCRSRAIVLCLSRTALRVDDVAKLDLKSIDFINSRICVKNGKSASARTVPMDKETGEAIADYVIKFRPKVPGRLFLRHYLHAGEPMGTVNLRSEVRSIAIRAGIEEFTPHMLRHTAATRMVNAGTPIKTISDILGHGNLETTTIYAKVDLVSLRRVCGSWPEVEVRHV